MDQREYVQEYICNRTKLYYRQTEYFDNSGEQPYTDEVVFIGVCKPMSWANNRLRVSYMLGVGGYLSPGYSYKQVVGEPKVLDVWNPVVTDKISTTDKYQFKSSTNFNSYFAWEFWGDSMNGV